MLSAASSSSVYRLQSPVAAADTDLSNMPIYEYKCLQCGNHLEAMQKISDEPLKECPKCGGSLEKQWSRTGFQFKGTGWYVTDYAGKAGAETSGEAKSGTAAKTDEKKTSAGGESTASADSASKSETTSTTSDKSKP